MRFCIMPGLPTHLVQELNVGTVLHDIYSDEQYIKHHISTFSARCKTFVEQI